MLCGIRPKALCQSRNDDALGIKMAAICDEKTEAGSVLRFMVLEVTRQVEICSLRFCKRSKFTSRTAQNSHTGNGDIRISRITKDGNAEPLLYIRERLFPAHGRRQISDPPHILLVPVTFQRIYIIVNISTDFLYFRKDRSKQRGGYITFELCLIRRIILIIQR